MKKTLRDRLEGSVAAELWVSGKMLLRSCVYLCLRTQHYNKQTEFHTLKLCSAILGFYF